MARPDGFSGTAKAMRVVERYHRVDHGTILYDMTVTDPDGFTRKPIVAPQRIMKLKPHEEIEEQPCVWSQENEVCVQRIRKPRDAQACEVASIFITDAPNH